MNISQEYLEERMKDPFFAQPYEDKLNTITNEKHVMYVLIGNIGSGKSTWVKQHKKPEDIVISLDNLRYCFNNGEYKFDISIEQTIFDICLYSLRRFTSSIFKSNIYLDNTNVNKKSREQFIKVAKENGYEIVAVVLPVLTKEESINRRMTNSHGNTTREVWGTVWDRFLWKYQVPTLEEGFDGIIKV